MPTGWSVPESVDTEVLRRRANEHIAYHSPIAHRLTAERTSYQSQMIPVTSYIRVACAETFTRYADMMRVIDALEDSDDVQNVYANGDISDEVLAQLDEE